MCNNNRAEQAAAQTRLYRERLVRVAEACGLSTSSPLGAEWVEEHMANDLYKALNEDALVEEAAMYYMIYRLSTYEYVDSDDLPHKLTYTQRARMLMAMRYGKDWSKETFERALENYANKLK